jgi:MFS family permease
MSDPYAVWRLPGFQRYTVAFFSMSFARQAEMVALTVYVYGLSPGAAGSLALGWLGLVQALPVILLAIPGGQMADHWDRRKLLAAMVGLTAGVSLLLVAATHLGLAAVWIYLLLTLSAVGQALGNPARSALLPQIVPAEGFSYAMAWYSSIFQIATMIGAAGAGALVAWRGGVPGVLFLVVLCRLLALAAIAALPLRPRERTGQTISLETLVAGVRFVWSQKPILATITLDLFAVLVGGCVYLLPAFAHLYHFGPAAVGYLLAAQGAGAILMSIVVAHAPPIRRAGWTMLWAVAAFGVCTIIFGLSRWFWLSMAMMFAMGAVDNISVIVRHTLVQLLTPDAMRGRVSAVNSIFIESSNQLGGLESGLTAWWLGPVRSVVFGGIGTLLIVVGAAVTWPQMLRIGSLRNLQPAEELADVT